MTPEIMEPTDEELYGRAHSQARESVVTVKRRGDNILKTKLSTWQENIERPVRTFLGRQGCIVLKPGRNAREIFSFSKPTVTVAVDRKPGLHRAIEEEAGPLDEVHKMSREDTYAARGSQPATTPRTGMRDTTRRNLSWI